MSTHKQIFLFIPAIVCFSMAMGIQDSVLNNYFNDVFHLTAGQRGFLELPREFPGFMVVLMAGALAVLAVTHLAMASTLICAVGTVGIVLVGPHYAPMLGMLMVSSAGMHLLMPATASIALGLSDESKRGRGLGRLGAVETFGAMMGSSLIWVFFSASGTRYEAAFLIAATMAACAAALYACMHIPHLHQRRARLVIRRKYWLYYLLESLFGARKQIFITFGFWVLVDVYGQEARGIAQLLFTASCIGLFFKPTVGLIIDRFGERTVMIADGLLLSVVCVGYGYAMHFTADAEQALWVARICFVCDNLLFSLGTGRAVYLSRVADTPQDLTSTLAMGVSVNHVASMTIPMIAGKAWEIYGYERVFLAAAVLALTASAAASLVPRRKTAQ